MTRDIGLTGDVQLLRLESLDHVRDCTTAFDDHADAGSGERLIGIGTAIACQDEAYTLF